MTLLKKHYYLGFNAKKKKAFKHFFTKATDEDYTKLRKYLSKRYGGEAVLCKNGRSALALALMAYFNEGDKVIVNGFTCYAVYEAVKAAGLTPIFADITKKDLNYDADTLNKLWEDAAANRQEGLISGIIVQNSLGNPVDMEMVEHFAGKHGLIIIEDLAHSVGIKYPDGREAGTVGAAVALSFGKEKAIDTVSGGAVVMRHPCNLAENEEEAPKIPGRRQVIIPSKPPRKMDNVRERLYPMFAGWNRALTHVSLNGLVMKLLIDLHLVERSADNRLDLERLPAKFEAKLAIEQLKDLREGGEAPLRKFYLVERRDEVLKKLWEAGYYFDGLWYEKPISPKRYYKKVHFDEKKCAVATEVAREIINFPTYYKKSELEPAREIVENYLIKEARDE